MASISNPFITSGYQGSEYFCNREEETGVLKNNLINGQSGHRASVVASPDR